MILETLYIETFGHFQNLTLDFSAGVNILEGKNESGKSTLAAFIKFMFYGFAGKERAEGVSWQTGAASGTVTFSDGGHRYRIERTLRSSGNEGKVTFREVLRIVDAENNMPCHKGECPGLLFFGVDADLFSATAFLSQIEGTLTGGEKVAAGVENILFSADESVNTEKALAKLDSARVSLLHKNEKGGRLYDLSRETAALEYSLGEALQVHDDILKKEARLDDLKENLTAAEEKKERLTKGLRQYRITSLIRRFDEKKALENELSVFENAHLPDDSLSSGKSEPEQLWDDYQTVCERLTEERAQREELSVKEPSPELTEYRRLGCRSGIEERLAAEKGSLKAKSILGGITGTLGVILLLLFGAGKLFFPHLAAMNENLFSTLFLIGGVLFMAVGIVFFTMLPKHRKEIGLLSLIDCDACEKEQKDCEANHDALRGLQYQSEQTERIFENKKQEIMQKYGSLEELSACCLKEKENRRAENDLRLTYEKKKAVLTQIEKDLSSHREEEVRASLDPTVDLSLFTEETISERRREADFAEKTVDALSRKAHELECELAGLSSNAADPSKLSDRLTAAKAEYLQTEKKYTALKLAIEKLSDAGLSLRGSVAPKLAANAAKLMAEITGGRYKELGVGHRFELSAGTDSGTRFLSSLSAGTQDAAYVSLRLVLIDLLYRRCLPPIILDESLARQDDDRLAAILKLLSASDKQTILFTSNGREAAAMEKIGEFRYIHL